MVYLVQEMRSICNANNKDEESIKSNQQDIKKGEQGIQIAKPQLAMILRSPGKKYKNTWFGKNVNSPLIYPKVQINSNKNPKIFKTQIW